MPEVKLLAETGRPHGSSKSRRLRHAGKIPGVVYGHGIEATPIAVEARALRAVLSTEAGTNVVVELDVDGAHHLAMARDIQRHPVRGTVAHVDFLVVNRNEVITVDVPVTLVGEATEVLRAGGMVDHQLFTLAVQTTPGRIPTSIDVDVSSLGVGANIRVAELTLPPGVVTEADPDAVVVVGHGPQAEAPSEEAAEEGAADEAAADGSGGSGGSGGDGGGSAEKSGEG
jgi:large subunit ribosomal protein L25